MSVPARKPRAYALVCPDLNGIVYELLEDDFGCADIDSQTYGVRHISVTGDPAGGYPYFTVPISQLREIQAAREEEQFV